MTERELVIVIIDDNKERMTLLRSFMPDYAKVITTLYGDAAKDVIRSNRVDIIIMYADDSRGHGLYMYGWLQENAQYATIPVMLLTKDEFSERSLDFMELGDAQFYEGEPEQFGIFSRMMQILEDEENKVYTAQIRAEEARLNHEKPAGWVAAGTGEVAKIVEEEKTATAISEMKPWQANSAAAVREILEARARERGEDDEVSAGINKAYAFASTVQVAHVKGRPQHTQTINDTYRRQQLKKSLERGERKMEELRKAIEVALATKERKHEEALQKAQSMKQAETFRKSEMVRMASVDKKKILVVDDDPTTLKTIKAYLQDLYDVTLVNSGAQAIDYIVRHKSDLLVIDFRMPMLDGAMTLKSIRMQPNGRVVPALFLTAHANQETVQNCIKAGAQGILPKPVSQESLRASVASLINKN